MGLNLSATAAKSLSLFSQHLNVIQAKTTLPLQRIFSRGISKFRSFDIINLIAQFMI